MSLIKEVAHYFLMSDRTLGRRERRLLDTILVRYRDISEKAELLERLCSTSEVKDPDSAVKRLTELRKEMDREIVRITSDLSELILKERIEFERDVNEPSEMIKTLFSTLDFYLRYLQSSKEIASTTLDKLKKIILGLQQESDTLLSEIDQKVEEVKSVFEREISKKGSAYSLSSKKIQEIAAAGDQWEREKIALSQKIRSIFKKLNRLEKELQRMIKKQYQGKDPSQAITALIQEQVAFLRQALTILSQQDKYPLTSGIKSKIARNISSALAKEPLILAKMFSLSIPAKITETLSTASAPEKKLLLKLTTKLAYQKTEKMRMYPVEFWLGQSRALGYLQANDAKNLAWLKELLSDGLLASNTGMMDERLEAVKELSRRGLLVSIHDQFMDHFSEGKEYFKELSSFILNRAELAKRVFGLIGSAMFDLERILLDAQLQIDQALDRFEKADAGDIRRVISLEAARKKERGTKAKEEKKLDHVRGKAVAEMTTLHGEVRQARTKNRRVFGGFFTKAAAVFITLSTLASAMAFSSNTGGSVPAQYSSRPGMTQTLDASQLKEFKLKSLLPSDLSMDSALPNPEKLDDQIAQKFKSAASPVEALYQFTDTEMGHIWEKGKVGMAMTLADIGISGVGRLGELSKEAERLHNNYKKGVSLTGREKQFLRNYYYLIAIGGKFKGMDESSDLLVHYLDGTGTDLKLDASIYKDSESVQAAQKIMLGYIRNQSQRGKIPSTGIISSDQVFKGQSLHAFPGGYGKSGGLAKGEPGDSKIYLIAEQDNQRLKNTNNRFILVAEYNIKGDNINVTWRVDDDYSFEANRGYVTEIPIPGTSQVLRISDELSAFLVKVGAKEFNHHARWSSIESFKG
ncbi:MAG: hypothetical protein WCV90_03120 [Candidatus Woesearchaeota archaeon]